MPKDIKTESSKYLQQLIDCCNGTLDNLEKFQDQLVKIIEVKKKQAEGTGSDIALIQNQDVLDAITNLDKINSVLPEAIIKMKEAYLQALSLSRKTDAKLTAAAGALMPGWHKDGEQDDETDS